VKDDGTCVQAFMVTAFPALPKSERMQAFSIDRACFYRKTPQGRAISIKNHMNTFYRFRFLSTSFISIP
jgi:hypothetical protein